VTFRDLYSFRRYRGVKSEVVDDVQAKVDLFKKTLLTGKFKKKCFPIHGDIDPRLVCKFRDIWLTGNR